VRRGKTGKELRLIPTICVLTEAHLEPSPANKPLLIMNEPLLSFVQEIKTVSFGAGN